MGQANWPRHHGARRLLLGQRSTGTSTEAKGRSLHWPGRSTGKCSKLISFSFLSSRFSLSLSPLSVVAQVMVKTNIFLLPPLSSLSLSPLGSSWLVDGQEWFGGEARCPSSESVPPCRPPFSRHDTLLPHALHWTGTGSHTPCHSHAHQGCC